MTTNEPIDPGPEPEGPARRDGPDRAVPHVVGHHIDLAVRMLEDLGLRARIVTTEVHDKTDRHVVSTHPAAGTGAGPGLTVEVVVGIAPVVADYCGLEVDEAVRLAEIAGHVVEVLHGDVAGPAGTITAQDPEPGERSRVVILRLAPEPDRDDRPPPPPPPPPAAATP